MQPHNMLRLASRTGAGVALALGLIAGSGGLTSASGGTLFVSPSGSPSNSDMSCATAKYSSINAAVGAAAPGSRVVVCAGTYAEDVLVSKALLLAGRHAVIDATGLDNGIKITHSWVTVTGFTVWGATGEGILAQGTPKAGPIVNGQPTTTGDPVKHVTIAHNTVRNNDQGTPSSSYLECQPQGQIPGDCGEGIHLMSVADSLVFANHVFGNSGGILLTDEFGPTHHNTIMGNVVEDNPFDCGITVASHNSGVDPVTLHRMRSFAGIYDNLIAGNVVRGNGLLGEGAGVLIAAAFPSAAAYDNIVMNNHITGNELAGVTLHSHAPGAFIGGNMILRNSIGENNLGGDPDAAVLQTTGILIFSAATPTHVTIAANTIYDDSYGIWLNSTVSAPGAAHANVFIGVGTHVKHG